MIVNVGFFGLVPAEEGATTESVEENLSNAIDQLATDVLDELNDQNVAESRQNGRLFLRRRRLKALSIRTPVGVDATEVGEFF